MAATSEKQGTPPLRVALFVDGDALDRFGGVVRHLLVGLVEQAIHPTLLSPDPRVESLSLGPIRTHRFEPVVWPAARRRSARIVEALSESAPAVVHALSGGMYSVAGEVAAAIDADLVLQVTSLADCEALSDWNVRRVARFIGFGQPLVRVLVDQLRIPADRVELVRPGVLGGQRIACFSQAGRIPTIVNTDPFERADGVHRLIDAVDRLRRDGRDIMVFLLGKGRREDRVRRMIRERNLSSFVILARPRGDLIPVLSQADLFVQPSQTPAFTADSLHAMAFGVAVVTYANSVADHLRAGSTALICDPAAPGALADALERLLDDRPYARSIAEKGMAYVRSNHAVSAATLHLADVYRSLSLAKATFRMAESRRT